MFKISCKNILCQNKKLQFTLCRVSGPKFGAGGTPTLAPLLQEVLNLVEDPHTGKKISELWNGELSTLGSGSDYTSFIGL